MSIAWNASPAGKAWRRRWANARYASTPRKLKQRHPRHRCTGCDNHGHNIRTCPVAHD